jgi:tetratricopeptide (TPR) repeat protein
MHRRADLIRDLTANARGSKPMMLFKRNWLATALLVQLLVSPALAQHEHHGHDEPRLSEAAELGSVSFAADCRPEHQAGIDRALALIHHMMYVQAREAFASIKQTDPDCAMAWWGVATTLFQPLWGTRPDQAELQRGQSAIARATEVAESDREKALIGATAAFFADAHGDDFQGRLNGWIEAMGEVYERFGEQEDIAALYALTLLTRAQAAEPAHRDRLHDEAEGILRGIWRNNSRHPGAIHYSIHATDVDGRAENALDMVEAYGHIAPHTAHALHMPSHIYVRLGDWEEVIDWNVRSADAALAQPVNGSVSHHFIHAIDYMIYAYLQQGRDELSDRVFAEAMDKGTHQASFVSAYHLAAMPARLAVERRDWAAARALEVRNPDYLPWDLAWWPEALSWFGRGLGQLHDGDLDQARQSIEQMARLRDAARSAGEAGMASYIEIDRLILDGWTTFAEGRAQAGADLVRAAVDLEASIEKHPVSPGALYPPREALGDLLMAQDQPAAALQAYQSADEVWPDRYNTHLGAARAALASGDRDQAASQFRKLIALAGSSQRDGIAQAHRYLNQN